MKITTDTKQRPPAAVAAFRLALAHSHGWASVLADSLGGREDWWAAAAAAEAVLAAEGLAAAEAAFDAALAEWRATRHDCLSHPGIAPGLLHTTGSGRLTWNLETGTRDVWRFGVARPWDVVGVPYEHDDGGGVEVLVALWAPDGTLTVVETSPGLVEDRHREVLAGAVDVAGRALRRDPPPQLGGLVERLTD